MWSNRYKWKIQKGNRNLSLYHSASACWSMYKVVCWWMVFCAVVGQVVGTSVIRTGLGTPDSVASVSLCRSSWFVVWWLCCWQIQQQLSCQFELGIWIEASPFLLMYFEMAPCSRWLCTLPRVPLPQRPWQIWWFAQWWVLVHCVVLWGHLWRGICELQPSCVSWSCWGNWHQSVLPGSYCWSSM